MDDVSSGRVDLGKVAPAALPAPMRAMAPEEQKAEVARLAEERKRLRGEIAEMSARRDAYLAREVEARGGAADSLDQRLFDAVRRQAGKAGITYESDAPRY